MKSIKMIATVIATTLFTSSFTYAGDNVDVSNKHEEEMKQNIEQLTKTRKILENAIDKEKEVSYNIDTTTVTFIPKNKDTDIVGELIKMNENLASTNNINETINSYGTITRYESQSQSIIPNWKSVVMNERIMNYKYKEKDGSIDSTDIKLSNMNNYILKKLKEKEKYTVFLNIRNEKLGKVKVDNENYSLLKIPSIVTQESTQAVVVKINEYKVVNIYQELPYNENDPKEYTATIIKLSK